MPRLKPIMLSSLILLASRYAHAEFDQADYLEAYKEMAIIACKNSPDAQCAENYLKKNHMHQACREKFDEIRAAMEQDNAQLNVVKDQCALQHKDPKQEVKCLMSSVQELAEHHNAVAAEALIKIHTKLNNKEAAQQWASKHKEIMNQKFPECA